MEGSETSRERTLSDVESVISRAKLRREDLAPLTQLLSLAESDASSENFRLLQLEDRLLEEIVSGRPVAFKGGRDDGAVLCTTGSTYEVKEAETSNSLLVVSGLKFPDRIEDASDDGPPATLVRREVFRVFHTYLEARPCRPRLKRLRESLAAAPYAGPELEYAVDRSRLCSPATLRDSVQASDLELSRGLSQMKAFLLDGHYRTLTFEYEFRVLSQMLDLIEENSWALDRVDRIETLRSLNNVVPEVILSSLFDRYTEETDRVDGKRLYRYDEREICRMFAQYILKDVGKFSLDDFMEVWKHSVPEGMTVDLGMLKGLALHDIAGDPKVIWAFHESKLPENINERLGSLFGTKEKWTLDEISPYIEPYTTDKLDENALLAKYARSSSQNNVRYYSAKHSK